MHGSRFGLALLGVAVAGAAWGHAEDNTPPINPDRPSFSTGAGITPKGRLLLEVGYRQTRAQGFTLHEYGDGQTFRLGINDRFELRFGATAYAVQRSPGANAEGWEDGTLGCKYVLHNGKENSGLRSPTYAVMFTSTLPTGGPAFREKLLQPRLTGIAAFGINEASELDANLAYTDASDSGNRFSTFSVAAVYNHSLSDKSSGFIELYSLLPGGRRGPNDDFADAGVAYRLTNEMQLDAFGGTQLDKHGQSAFFGFGASFRF